ncbi:MAG: hypothetical protein IIY58_02085 [Aeriscardovia sp.]|nr:hypothetical protein [Aeriscardovia sp.]
MALDFSSFPEKRAARKALFRPPRDCFSSALFLSFSFALSFFSKSPIVWALNALFALPASGWAFERMALPSCPPEEKPNYDLKMPALSFKKTMKEERKKTSRVLLTSSILLFILSFSSLISGLWFLILPAPLASALIFEAFLGGARKRCREKREWQKKISSWFEDSGYSFLVEDEKKENGITILRLKPESMEKTSKLSPLLLKERLPKTWKEALILPTRHLQSSIDPHSVRLVLFSEAKSLEEAQDENQASLLASIAYGLAARSRGKRAPLVTAYNVGVKEPAWLFKITPPPGGAGIEEMGDWLQDPTGPASFLKTEVLPDLASAFHLCTCGHSLSNRGNSYRDPGFMREISSFERYIKEGIKWSSFQRKWASVSKLSCPDPVFSEIQSREGIDLLPLKLDPSKIFDYAKADLTKLEGAAPIMAGSDGSRSFLVQAQRQRMEDLKEGGPCQKAYVCCLVLKSLAAALAARKWCEVDFCSFEGKKEESSIWRIGLCLRGGATVADLRKKSETLKASIGSEVLLIEYLDSARCSLWLFERKSLEKGMWKREKMREEAMDLFLSAGWQEAGVFNKSGEGPKLVKREEGASQSSFKAFFSLPLGVSPGDLKEGLPLFLGYSGFDYGRALPSDSGKEEVVFLSPKNPFANFAKADFKREEEISMGLGDMGQRISWNLSSSPHLLVMGRTGAGKSSLLSLLAAKGALAGWKTVVIDPCKGAPDFSWARKKGTLCGAGEFERAEKLVKIVSSIMRKRAGEISSMGFASSRQAGFQDILIVFDEFNGFISSMEAKEKGDASDIALARQNAFTDQRNRSISSTVTMLGNIATQGRSAGIHLLIGAQRLSLKEMEKFHNGRAFYRSLGKIMLGSDSPAGVFQTSNLKEANRLLSSLAMPKGRGLYEDGQGRLEALQSFYASKEEMQEALSGLPDCAPLDCAPKEEEAPEGQETDEKDEKEEEEEVVDFGLI